jgi:threonine dehydrogenase-like Zn-dependent dehydrogenase
VPTGGRLPGYLPDRDPDGQAGRHGGQHRHLGPPGRANPNDLVLSEVNLVGSICYNRDHPATIRLVQDGRIDTGGLITIRLVGCGW